MTIQPISVTQWLPLAGELVRRHYDELAVHPSVMELAPDLDGYARLEAAGSLIALGAFDDADLIAYSVTIVHDKHLHYAGLRVAMNDVLFVDAPHRGSRIGLDLIAATEAEAKSRGCAMVVWHAKPDTALHAILTKGYAVQDIAFSKVL